MIEGFGKELQAVWDIGVFGTNLGEIFQAFGIFLLFIFARRLFFHTVMKSLKLLAKKTQTDIDDQVIAALEQPLEFAFVVIGLYVAGQFVLLSDTAAHLLTQFVRSLIALTLFWAIYRVVDPLSALFDRAIGLFGSESMHETVKGFFVKLVKAIIVCLRNRCNFSRMGI